MLITKVIDKLENMSNPTNHKHLTIYISIFFLLKIIFPLIGYMGFQFFTVKNILAMNIFVWKPSVTSLNFPLRIDVY